MKTVAFISVFLLLFLSIQPLFIKWVGVRSAQKIPNSNCCKKSPGKDCSEKKSGKTQSQYPCNTCNPFMSCNLCGYINEEQQKLQFPLLLFDAETTNGLNNFILSSYVADCWHPPVLFQLL